MAHLSTLRFITVLIIILLIAGIVFSQTPEKYYLLKAGQMYDSENNVFVANQQILIKGNVIVKVGQKLDVP